MGTHLKDYRAIYIGPGRPPQGGNLESNANSALCRAETLNAAASLEGEVFGESAKSVTVDDINPAPIAINEVMCRLADFEAGSYNASAFMGTDWREDPLIGGLAVILPHKPEDLLSKDSTGIPFSTQYFPHIESIEVRAGAKRRQQQ